MVNLVLPTKGNIHVNVSWIRDDSLINDEEKE